MKRLAVIDLGTNTFHLLIAGYREDIRFVEIYRERIYVKLGQDGTSNLSELAMRRACDAIEKFRDIIDLYEVLDIRAVATAAFRTASNSQVLIQRLSRLFDIHVDVISGDREAELIFEGVKHSGALTSDPHLIMDIGGGSVEFILGNLYGIRERISLPLGVSLLKNSFHHNEPIREDERHALKTYLTEQLQPVRQWLTHQPVTRLTGSSGTFDVLADAISEGEITGLCKCIPSEEIIRFSQNICALSLEERLAHISIPDNRADLIVVALLLIETVLALDEGMTQVFISPYALKEGALLDLIESNKIDRQV